MDSDAAVVKMGVGVGAPLQDVEGRGRLVLISQTGWHGGDGQPEPGVETRCARWLSSRERPFSRVVQVGGEWSPLVPQGCWIEPQDVGLVVVKNLEGESSFRTVRPTAEELEEAEGRLILIGLAAAAGDGRTMWSPKAGPPVPFEVAYPGGESRLNPLDAGLLRIAASPFADGRPRPYQLRCRVYLYPR